MQNLRFSSTQMIINYFSLKQSLRDRSMKSHAWTHSVSWNVNHAEQVCSLVPRRTDFMGCPWNPPIIKGLGGKLKSLGLCSLFNLIWKHLSPVPTWKLQRSSHQLNSRIKMFNFKLKGWFLLAKITSGEWNFSIFCETFYIDVLQNFYISFHISFVFKTTFFILLYPLVLPNASSKSTNSPHNGKFNTFIVILHFTFLH